MEAHDCWVFEGFSAEWVSIESAFARDLDRVPLSEGILPDVKSPFPVFLGPRQLRYLADATFQHELQSPSAKRKKGVVLWSVF